MADIDVLQIEIESNSLGASKNIKELGVALGELKKNGGFGTAVKNMNELRKSLQLFNGVPSNYSKIIQLKDALNKLSGVKFASNVGDTLKKIADGMRELGGTDVSTVVSKINDLAPALTQLSKIKSGGVGTMVNGLAKIGEVTAKLDKKTIDEFAERVETLTKKLGPLSEKMTTIKAGFSSINSKARSAGAGAKQMGNDLDGASINLSSFIHIIQNAYHAINNLIQKFKQFISSAVEWDGIAARFGRGFGSEAEKTYEWIQKLNDEMGINVQQFMQYSSVYATMLTGFGVAHEDATKMALGYTELTYDIWAGYNDIYKSYADAADAVKSAIAGEVEPIRRAGFTIVEATLEQTAANHGLKISLENATEAQKSYLRYLTLVEQAKAQDLVGTYAKELSTAEGLLRTASQQVKSLSQALGSLFLPILVMVMPYVQAFVELLTEAVHWLANLFGVTIQSVDWSKFNEGAGGAAESTENLGSAFSDATKAAKELKNATLGFDELNVISPPASSGSGLGAGSSGGGFSDMDVESLWNDSIFKSIGDQVDDIKERLKDWMPTIGAVGAALGALGLAKLLYDIDDASKKLTGLPKAFTVGSIAIAVGALVWNFTGAYLESGDWLDWLTGLGVTAIGTGLAYKFGGKGGAGFTLLVSGAAMLGRLVFDLSEGTVDFGDSQTWVTLLTGGLEAVIGGVLTWKVLGPAIKTAFGKLATSFGSWFSSSGASSAASSAASKGGWIGLIIAAIIAQIEFVAKNWDEVSGAIVEFYNNNLKPIFDEIGGHFEEIGEALSPLIETFKENIGKFVTWMEDSGLWDIIKNLTSILGGTLFFGTFSGIAGIFKSVTTGIEGFVQVITGAIKVLAGFIELLKALWEGDWDGVKKGFGKIVDGLGDAGEGLYDSTLGAFFALFEGTGEAGNVLLDNLFDFRLDEWFNEKIAPFFTEDVPAFFKETIPNWFTGLFDGDNKLEFDIWPKNNSSEWWSNVKSWWRKKVGNVESFKTNVKNQSGTWWGNVKKWWGRKVGDAESFATNVRNQAGTWWSNTKKWWGKKVGNAESFATNVKNNAVTWWSNVKKWWGKKTGNAGNFTTNVKNNASTWWTNVKKWWNSKSGDVSFGAKVKNTASTWWSNIKKWWDDTIGELKLKIKTPSITVKWNYDIPDWQKTVANFLFDKKALPKLGVEWKADGGFVDQGQMFIAREAGPEMVGRIGSRNAVANNDQIVTAISEGVYGAVMAAMSGNSNQGNQEINIYLDGKKITASVEKRQKERGANLMTGGMAYGY